LTLRVKWGAIKEQHYYARLKDA